jgi:hypothetical protein
VIEPKLLFGQFVRIWFDPALLEITDQFNPPRVLTWRIFLASLRFSLLSIDCIHGDLLSRSDSVTFERSLNRGFPLLDGEIAEHVLDLARFCLPVVAATC